MATHSSILTWRIPWTEEPGRLQSMGLRKPGTNGVNGVIDGPMHLLTDGRPAIEGFDY